MTTFTENRQRIEQIVKERKSIRYSRLKDAAGLENGVLQHHIHHSDSVEQRNGAIVSTAFCDTCDLASHCGDQCILTLLRKPVKRAIVEGLRDGKSQNQLADELNRDKSTISYHVNDLEEHGILDGKDPVDAVETFLDEQTSLLAPGEPDQ